MPPAPAQIGLDLGSKAFIAEGEVAVGRAPDFVNSLWIEPLAKQLPVRCCTISSANAQRLVDRVRAQDNMGGEQVDSLRVEN